MIVDDSLMSKQSLGKTMKNVKNALPQSPWRKKVVVRVLATSLDLIQQKGKASHRLEHCHIDTVQTFYHWEVIAWFMPGKQDVVTIWDENGDKHKKQKRILKVTIGEAYNLFVDENPDVTIGKSKFAGPRLKEVFLSSKMPCNVCRCINHENMILFLQELHCMLCDMFSLYGKEFITSCVCEIDSKKCLSSECA